MINTLKVSAFIVLIVVAIAGFATMIPQVESPAPEALEITGEMTGPELAAMGQQVYESPEAGCTACHAIGREGLRGPDLAGIGATAAERVNGETAEDYLHESIVDPCAHIVEGYDCLMPTTLLNTLGEAKVIALTAYMQSLGGEVTVSYSGEQAANNEDQNGSGNGGGGLAGSTAEEILAGAGCVGCHKIGSLGTPQGMGPDLTGLGAKMTAEEIRQSILDPDAVVADDCPKQGESESQATGACPPGVMPKDYGQKLSAAQMETLVIFLTGLK